MVKNNFDKEMSKKSNEKILVICQYYKPEPFRISDICEELVRKGHEVHVVTGYPNYPEGRIYKGYGVGKKIDEKINGVSVHRCFTFPRKKGSINRMLNYYSFAISSLFYVLSSKCKTSDKKKFDVVYLNQLSPIMMSYAAIAYKIKYCTPIIMYCLDLWPESLVAGGIKRNSIIYKYYHKVSKNIYRKVDKILVSSSMFAEYLNKEFKINKSIIQYLPQYAEKIFNNIPLKKENGIFEFMFAGNIGSLQSIETIIEAADMLKEKPIRFHIIGEGTQLEYLKNLAINLDNIFFYGRKPIDEMPRFYEKADAMLVTMKSDAVLSLTIPGKVQSYMAAGKPIIGAIDGETRKLISESKCGFCGSAENSQELANNILKFINSDTDRAQLGKNARIFYQKHFEKELFMEKIERELIVKL